MSKHPRKKLKLAITLVALAAVVGVFCWLSVRAEKARPELAGPYDVAWVTDGDTVEVRIDGTETAVRLIGIDAPESASHDESQNTEEGRIAAQFLKDFLRGEQVWLEYDEQRYDKYGRTLAYVYVDRGETMVEDVILENGMADVLAIEPNVKYERRFEKIRDEARRKRVGIWADWGTRLL